MTTFPVNPATISATITLIHVSVMKWTTLLHKLSANGLERLGPEASGDLKDLAAEFSTNETTGLSIDDDRFNIIEGLIDNKLPKRLTFEGLTEKCLRLENCKLSVVPKKKKKIERCGTSSKMLPKKLTWVCKNIRNYLWRLGMPF